MVLFTETTLCYITQILESMQDSKCSWRVLTDGGTHSTHTYRGVVSGTHITSIIVFNYQLSKRFFCQSGLLISGQDLV